MILTKRAYDKTEPSDGCRVLVDRFWPRGITKEDLAIDYWLKAISPSNELRQWFNHKPERWTEFTQRYGKELDALKEVYEPILKLAQDNCVTLIYAAKDRQFNNATALKQYLDQKQKKPKKA